MLPPSEPKSAGVDDELGRETLAVVEWTADDREDNWLISYADLLSVIFTMVVLLFGRMTVVAETPAEQASGAEPSQHVDRSHEPLALLGDRALQRKRELLPFEPVEHELGSAPQHRPRDLARGIFCRPNVAVAE